MTNDDIIRAGAVILKDLRLFNQSAVFLESRIDPAIRNEVGDLATSWLEDNGWKGEADVSEDFAELWVAPPDWRAEEDDWLAWYMFGYRAEEESASYPIADIFGVGETDWGFRFEVNHGWFGGRPKWNAFAKTLDDDAKKLADLGWQHLGKGVFFLVAPLTAGPLVAAWETEDWTEALAPLRKTLDALKAAKPIFDDIIARAKPKPE